MKTNNLNYISIRGKKYFIVRLLEIVICLLLFIFLVYIIFYIHQEIGEMKKVVLKNAIEINKLKEENKLLINGIKEIPLKV